MSETKGKKPDFILKTTHNGVSVTIGVAWEMRGQSGTYYSCQLNSVPFGHWDGNFRMFSTTDDRSKEAW